MLTGAAAARSSAKLGASSSPAAMSNCKSTALRDAYAAFVRPVFATLRVAMLAAVMTVPDGAAAQTGKADGQGQGGASATSRQGKQKPVPASRTLVDKRFRPYVRVPGISGSLHSIGSDTLNNLMTIWAEAFQKLYPQVRIQIEGKGSSTAPPALIEGTAQFGPMSREMMDRELDAFVRKFGYKPSKVGVAVDALALFVNKDNPLDRLSLRQVDSIFSSTRKRGGAALTAWGDLRLTGDWSKRPISLFGRNSASGSYGYFKTFALKKGDLNNRVKEQPGSASVVRSITEDVFGIGYSGIGYETAGVKALLLCGRDGKYYSAKNAAHVLSGRYPLSRVLYVYVNRHPRRPLDPLVSEFFHFVLSRDGQVLVEKNGFLPLPWDLAQRFRRAFAPASGNGKRGGDKRRGLKRGR